MIDGLNEASRMGTVDDVYNLIQLFGILMSFVLPTIIIFIFIYYVIRFKKRHSKKQVKTEVKASETKGVVGVQNKDDLVDKMSYKGQVINK